MEAEDGTDEDAAKGGVTISDHTHHTARQTSSDLITKNNENNEVVHICQGLTWKVETCKNS